MTLSRAESARYMRELSDLCISIMSGTARPQAFRNFAGRAVNAGYTDSGGRGVDSTACFLHDDGVDEWVRRIALLLPHLRAFHGEARGWLERRDSGKRDGLDGRIPFNIFLGGEQL